LHYWAKIDNLELYNKPVVSENFKILFCHRFIYKEGFLKCFNGVYWKQDVEKVMLHNFLKKDYYNILCDLLHQYDIKHRNTSIQYDVNAEHTKKIAKLRVKLEDLRYFNKREGYVKELILSLENNDIKFDTKNSFICF